MFVVSRGKGPLPGLQGRLPTWFLNSEEALGVCVCVRVCACLCARVSAHAHRRARTCVRVGLCVCALCPCFCAHARLWTSSGSGWLFCVSPCPAAVAETLPSPLSGIRDPGWAQVRGWFLSLKSRGFSVCFFFPSFFKSHTKREALKSTTQTPRIPCLLVGNIPGNCPAMLRLKTP